MIAKNLELGQHQMNCDSLPECPTTSCSMNDVIQSPLLAFLRSIQSTIESKGVVSDNNISSSYNLDLLAPSPLPGSRENNAILDARDYNQSSLSFSLDKMALVQKPRNRNISNGAPFVGKDPGIFIQNNDCQQQSLKHISGPHPLPREILFNVKPTPLKVSNKTKKKRRQKRNSNVRSKKEEVSFYALNKLMERTASSRCVLFQQMETSNESSASLMKSLSATIVSSTKITSSTSVTSVRNATVVADTTVTTSDSINSSFDEAIELCQQKAKKRRITFSIDHSLFASSLKPSKNFEELRHTSVSGVDQSTTSSMTTSLPSCGSLASSSSENESSFQQVIQNPSSFAPVEINESIQVTPFREDGIVYSDAIQLNIYSSRVYSKGSEHNFKQQTIQALSSSSGREMRGSFQSNREFNSYQASVCKNDHSTCRPTCDFNAGDSPLMF